MSLTSSFRIEMQAIQTVVRGFTLAELLIALAILGVIATFTIPKVLTAQNDGKYKAIAKEAAGMLSGALQAYKMEHSLTSATLPQDLTPYMNYLKVDSSTVADDQPGSTSFTCGANVGGTLRCLKLHNGAILEYNDTANIGGTGSLDAFFFYLDPDGTYSGSATGSGKSVVLFLYANGKVRTWGTVDTGTSNGIYGGSTYNPVPVNDPSWFSWD